MWGIGFAWFFRGWLFENGDGIWGDQGDARLLIAWLEHWHRWFTGAEADWRSPPFFFPERNVLGFSDAYFLYAVPYSLSRQFDRSLLGLHVCDGWTIRGRLCEFHATRGRALASQHSCCWRRGISVCLCEHDGGQGRPRAELLRHAVTGHFRSCRRGVSPERLAIKAACCRGGGSARTYLFYGLSYGLVLFAACRLRVPSVFDRMRSRTMGLSARDLRRASRRCLCIPGRIAFGILPFLILYGPVLLSGLRRSINDHRVYAPRFTDIINVGPGNAIWGRLLEWLGIVDQPGRPGGEIELGYSLGVFCTWSAFTILLFRSYLKGKLLSVRDALLLACGLALFLS